MKKQKLILEKEKIKNELKNWFLEKLNGCIEKNINGDVLLINNGEKLFLIDDKYFWCDYQLIWEHIKLNLSTDYNDVQNFIKDVLIINEKYKNLTPMLNILNK